MKTKESGTTQPLPEVTNLPQDWTIENLQEFVKDIAGKVMKRCPTDFDELVGFGYEKIWSALLPNYNPEKSSFYHYLKKNLYRKMMVYSMGLKSQIHIAVNTREAIYQLRKSKKYRNKFSLKSTVLENADIDAICPKRRNKKNFRECVRRARDIGLAECKFVHYEKNQIGKENQSLQSLEIKELIKKSLKHINKQELWIIKQIFYKDVNCLNLSKKLKISHQRVDRIKHVALRKMRTYLEGK